MENNIIIQNRTFIGKDAVDILEKKLEINLSQYYKDFLSKSNGGQAEKNEYFFEDFNGNKCSSDIYFFSVVYEEYKDLLIEETEKFKHRIPKNFIAIGSDSIRNLIIMNTITEEIYLWKFMSKKENAEISNCFLLAKNFKEFFEYKLQESILEEENQFYACSLYDID